MIKVKGKDVNLYIYRSGSPILAVCATNISKKTNAERINITTVDSGRENEYIGGSTDSELTLEGVRTLDEPGSWQADDFEEMIGEVIRVLLIYTDTAGNNVIYDGNTLIADVDDSNNVSEYSTFSVTLVRNGVWTKLNTLLPIILSAVTVDGHTIKVVFNKSVIPTLVGWSVFVQDTLTTSAFDSLTGAGSVWYFTVSTLTFLPGQTLFINYNALTGNTLDLAGNELPTTSLFNVINNLSSGGVVDDGVYSAPMWVTGTDMTMGSTVFTNSSLIGATEMNFIIVNKVVEYINEDYTFDNTTGTITRVNEWQAGDVLITPHKTA
jgi:predicted secreted protein